jgi:hypothetical protein
MIQWPSLPVRLPQVSNCERKLYNRNNNKKAKASRQNSDMNIMQKTINTDLSIITNHYIASLEEGAENIWI